MSFMRRRVGIAVATLLVTGSVAGFAVQGGEPIARAATAAEAIPALEGAAARTIGADADSYAPIVERVAPAVVTIRSERVARAAQQFPFAQDPFFRDFFGDRFGRETPGQMPQERRQSGLGSGVLVSEDGYILTNHHVVDGAEQLTVELMDRRSFTAKVVGTDPPSDLAVLKIEGAGFPTLPLGNSDQVRVGDVVLAVGNPMGVGQTVTMGIISAKGRATGLGNGSFEDFLQTDAPINQGNSGGALVSTRGELVGINSQILSPSGGNIGIGFAIPANMAVNVMDALIADGRVHRGMLGVTVQGVTADVAKSLTLDSIGGALVSDVRPDSAADEAGIERGDVITAINGATVTDSNALRNQIAAMRPGTEATLTVLRDGRERTVRATLDELPAQGAGAAGRRDVDDGVGLSVQPNRGGGLVVSAVDPSGRAARSGFQQGDVILEVDGNPVASASALREAIGEAGERPALVLVRRGETTIYLTI